MKIRLNGEEKDCACASLAELWELQKSEQEIRSDSGIAIALNGRVVRRKDWAGTAVQSGDSIEIVRAFAGG